MNKLSRLIIAALVGMSLSMPAFAQEANGKAKTDAQTTHAKKKGSTASKKAGQMTASNSATPAKAKPHKVRSAKKGATAGKKEGQATAPKAVAQTKSATHSASTSKKPATGARKHGPAASTTKVKSTGKKADKNQKVKS